MNFWSGFRLFDVSENDNEVQLNGLCKHGNFDGNHRRVLKCFQHNIMKYIRCLRPENLPLVEYIFGSQPKSLISVALFSIRPGNAK